MQQNNENIRTVSDVSGISFSVNDNTETIPGEIDIDVNDLGNQSNNSRNNNAKYYQSLLDPKSRAASDMKDSAPRFATMASQDE